MLVFSSLLLANPFSTLSFEFYLRFELGKKIGRQPRIWEKVKNHGSVYIT
jgi:hypothetical protein